MKTIQPHIDVSCAIIEKDGLVLAAQSSEAMNMPLKWEFSGGKLQPELDQLLPKQRQQLATLRDTIRPKLFSGELTVEVTQDEAASC